MDKYALVYICALFNLGSLLARFIYLMQNEPSADKAVLKQKQSDGK